MYDTIIVGGGLAGACAALHLSRAGRVLLLEAHGPAAGASGAAAGLVNPLMSRRARPVWHMEEALAALRETLALADAGGLFSDTGVLRPAADPEQRAWFVEAATRYPEAGQWLPPAAVQETYPAVLAPYGALLVLRGGAIAVPELVQGLLRAAQRHGAELRTGATVVDWGEAADRGWIDVNVNGLTERISARRVLLAVGASWVRFPELARLRLHRVKGQVAFVSRPADLDGAVLPHLAGTGYVVAEEDTLVVGSSYEHDFQHIEPSRATSHEILAKAAEMLPALASAEILEEMAGVRVNVPGTRLPMVGPLPGRKHVWVLTGLGSKGLLMAPLLACRLCGFFSHLGQIPPEVRVRERKG